MRLLRRASTTTRWSTIGRTTRRQAARRPSYSCSAAPPPSRPGTSTCRCAAPVAARSRHPGAIAAFRLGNLTDIAVLDTRQYRTPAAVRRRVQGACAEADDPGPHHAGGAAGALARRSAAREQDDVAGAGPAGAVLAARLQRCSNGSRPNVPGTHDLDAWDGARRRAIACSACCGGPGRNAVVLTGDAHYGMAFDVKEDWNDPTTRRPPRVEFLARRSRRTATAASMPECRGILKATIRISISRRRARLLRATP